MQVKTRGMILATIILASAAYYVSTLGRGDPSLWLKDFETLQHELADGYVNLEWSAERHQLDLAQLSKETAEKLRATSSRRKARRIIEGFLGRFGDPHLRSEAAAPPSDSMSASLAWAGPSATASHREALSAFGYRKGKPDYGVDFDTLPGFDPFSLGERPFPAGVLMLESGRRLGILRIKYFGEDRYYDDAAATWDSFRGSFQGTCDGNCWWRFTLQVRTRLLRRLQERVEELERAGIDALLVDVTGNGGGSEWCEDVARFFTSKHLRRRNVRFIRHPHWAREIEREIGWIQEDLGRSELPDEFRTMLNQSLVEHQGLLEEVRAGCDASVLWEGRGIECQRLATDTHGQYDVPSAAQGAAAKLSAEHILFTPVRHPGFVGTYSGPLFVVIDGATASASEQFVTLLQANDAATIVGETSLGAGCGYTRGGIQLYLEHLELRVRMPDCMRFRADGENEIAGVEPDLVGWSTGTKGKERARSLAAALDALPLPSPPP